MARVYGFDVDSKELKGFSEEGAFIVPNEGKEIRKWLRTVPKGSVVALESTGGYGVELAEIAHKKGCLVFVLAPRQIAAHRKSLARRAKNDRLDAKLIFEFVQDHQHRLKPFAPWKEELKKLRDAVRLRTRLAKDRQSIRLKLRAYRTPQEQIDLVCAGLDAHIEMLDKEIEKALKGFEEAEAIQSIKGVGPLTTAASIAALKQFSFQSADAFVAYVGLDITVKESGKSKSKERISSWGDVTLRSLFYLCGKSAANTKDWQHYVIHLEQKGFKPIQIHCAIARRIARLAYTLFKSKQTFNPELIKPKKSKEQHDKP